MEDYAFVISFVFAWLSGWLIATSQWHFWRARKLRQYRESGFDPRTWP